MNTNPASSSTLRQRSAAYYRAKGPLAFAARLFAPWLWVPNLLGTAELLSRLESQAAALRRLETSQQLLSDRLRVQESQLTGDQASEEERPRETGATPPVPPLPPELDDGLPIPPPELIFLATAAYDAPGYLSSGASVATKMREQLLKNELRFEDFQVVLDFGCGSGRVLRYFHDEGPKLHGTDYNPALINWAKQNLSFADFSVNDFDGFLPFRDGMFDFIYAFSVFTHLTADNQTHWMNELRRVLRPGGYCYLTTHGDFYVDQIPEQLRGEFRSGHLVIVNAEREGSNLCGAYHPETYVRDVLARGLEVVDFFPDVYPQDAWLLRNPEPGVTRG